MTEDFELEVDLVNGLLVHFDDGAIGTIATTGSLRPGQEEWLDLRIDGTRGHVRFELTSGRATIVGPDGSVEELPELPANERSPEAAPARHLVDLILGRATNGSPSSIGIGAVEVVEALYLSAREQRTVQLRRGPPA